MYIIWLYHNIYIYCIYMHLQRERGVWKVSIPCSDCRCPLNQFSAIGSNPLMGKHCDTCLTPAHVTFSASKVPWNSKRSPATDDLLSRMILNAKTIHVLKRATICDNRLYSSKEKSTWTLWLLDWLYLYIWKKHFMAASAVYVESCFIVDSAKS